MLMDYNDAQEQRGDQQLIPDGTVASVHLTIRRGGGSEGGWLKPSKDGNSEALDCELTLLDTAYAKRKFWVLLTMMGTTEGHGKAIEISHRIIRAILESSRGIKPSDQSESAKAARRINDISDLNGLRFVVKIGIEVGSPKPNGGGSYPDKNKLIEVITPPKVEWKKVEPATTVPTAQGSSSPARVEKIPAWAGDDGDTDEVPF